MHQYLNQSISWGTHRLQDLSPAFSQLVKNIGYEPAAQIPADALANPECSWWDTHDAVEVNVALFDQLNELAPGGWYFGSHPSDGDDYGFWPEEDDE